MAEPEDKKGDITQREFDARFKLERDYLDKCQEVQEQKFSVVTERFKGMDRAISVASEEAQRQYHTLNETRRDMLTKDVFNVHKERLERIEKTVYIGLGVAYAIMFLLNYFAK